MPGADDVSALVQAVYNQAKLQGDSDQLAFSKAQAALGQAANYANTYGYAPGGNWMTWGPGGPTQPAAGTPTMAELAQQQSLWGQNIKNALDIAGVTGYYAQPLPSQYSPGTILTANNGMPGMGNAYGIVNADGSVQMLAGAALQQAAAQRGTTAQAMMQQAQQVDWNTLQGLSQGPPQGPQQQTLAAQQQQYSQAAQSAGLTGMFYDPTQTANFLMQQGKALNGQAFTDLPPDQQQYWLQYNQNNPTAAAQGWARSVNATLQAQGYRNPQAQGQQTLAAQSQYFNQAQNLAQMYGQYYAPQQAGQAAQAGVNAPQAGQQTLAAQQQYWQQQFDIQKQQQQTAQNYLTMLSNLRGPADWAQYQKVLGATPGGMQDLVRAAAGQYVPGAGATSGVNPNAVTLGGFINQATGQGQTPTATQTSDQAAMNSLVAPNQMAPQTWNALTPSQQQLLLGQWESQGYTQQDAQNLFKQSLPNQGTGTGQVGGFKLQ